MTEKPVQAASVGKSGECLHADCGDDAKLAAICDTGQIKHYCVEHGGGRRAGHARVEKWRAL